MELLGYPDAVTSNPYDRWTNMCLFSLERVIAAEADPGGRKNPKRTHLDPGWMFTQHNLVVTKLTPPPQRLTCGKTKTDMKCKDTEERPLITADQLKAAIDDLRTLERACNKALLNPILNDGSCPQFFTMEERLTPVVSFIKQQLQDLKQWQNETRQLQGSLNERRT